jgi:hypothetical protein
VPGIRGDVDAVAFVGDSQPTRALMPRIEHLPLASVIRLAELPQTDAELPSADTAPATTMQGPVLRSEAPSIWAGIAVAVLVWRWLVAAAA